MNAQSDKFWHTYAKHLAACAAEGLYPWPPENAPDIADKMRATWYKGTGSKDGPAFKRTCKELGIPNTYQAIRAYCAGLEVLPRIRIARPNGKDSKLVDRIAYDHYTAEK